MTDFVAPGQDAPHLLQLVAAVERQSEHLLVEAVVRHADAQGGTQLAATGFRTVEGKGAAATVEGQAVLIGNCRLLIDKGTSLSTEDTSHLTRMRSIRESYVMLCSHTTKNQ